jgi:hypothetical protein
MGAFETVIVRGEYQSLGQSSFALILVQVEQLKEGVEGCGFEIILRKLHFFAMANVTVGHPR